MRNPSPEEIEELLRGSRNVAVVGLSADPSRPSHDVARALQSYGFRVFPVNPALEGPVLGEKSYSSLREIEEPVDIVDVFRRSEKVMPIAEDAVAIGAKAIWLQLGVINESAVSYAAERGLTTVSNRCIKVDYSSISR
jgi:predicted CoA-binding protein